MMTRKILKKINNNVKLIQTILHKPHFEDIKRKPSRDGMLRAVCFRNTLPTKSLRTFFIIKKNIFDEYNTI